MHPTVDFTLFRQPVAGQGESAGRQTTARDEKGNWILPINFPALFLTIHNRLLKRQGAVGTT